jgi:hypothetical protein
MLLPGISVVGGQRHLIVLAGAEFAAASDLNRVAKVAVANQVAIHVVMLDTLTPAVEGFCRSTGGTSIAARSAQSLEHAYKQIYLGLIDRYEISYRPKSKLAPAESSDPGSVRLRIFSTDGYGECSMHLS